MHRLAKVKPVLVGVFYAVTSTPRVSAPFWRWWLFSPLLFPYISPLAMCVLDAAFLEKDPWMMLSALCLGGATSRIWFLVCLRFPLPTPR